MASYSHDALDVTVLMTAASAPSPCVVSTDHEDVGGEGWKAFNHSASSGWQTDQGYVGNPASIVFDLGEGNAEVVTSYTVTSNADAGKTWKVYGSNNSSDWTELDSRASIEFEDDQVMKSYSFTNTTAYRYYKLTMEGYDSYGGFQEIEYLGAPADPEIDGNIDISPLLTILGSLSREGMEAIIEIPIGFGGTLYLPEFTVNGSMTIPITIGGTIFVSSMEVGAGAVIVPMFKTAIEGWVGLVGEGGVTVRIATMSGDGVVGHIATVDVVIPIVLLSAEGVYSPVADVLVKIPMLNLSASAAVGDDVPGAITVPFITLVATGLSAIIGEGAVSIPLFMVTGVAGDFAPSSLVLNIKNSALTKYDNYIFNSLCCFKGVNLGATSTGIFNLDEGNLDDGVSTIWNFRLGNINLEIKNKKKIRHIWLFCKRSGNLIVTIVQPDGDEYEYDADNYESTEDGVRVKFGKGIRSKYVSLDIRNDEPATITLDLIRLVYDKFTARR